MLRVVTTDPFCIRPSMVTPAEPTPATIAGLKFARNLMGPTVALSAFAAASPGRTATPAKAARARTVVLVWFRIEWFPFICLVSFATALRIRHRKREANSTRMDDAQAGPGGRCGPRSRPLTEAD